MNRHPGGMDYTLSLVSKCGFVPGARILDMGAGGGETVRLLRSMGFEALGIDISPRSELVLCGDFLSCPYPDEYFDGAVSQCAFFVSGRVEKAFTECSRILKNGGIALISDIFREDAGLLAERAGFKVLFREDITPLWKDYYIEALWRGDADYCPGMKGCVYQSLILKKE